MLKTLPSRRKAILALALLSAVLALVAWWLVGRGGGELDEAWKRVSSQGRIRVGIDPSYPPFELTNEATGEIVGYDVDLAREVGRRLGVDVEFVLIGFDSLYDAVRTGKVDVVISGMPYDPNWTEDVSYGIWYFNAGQFLVVRNEERGITSVESLAGRRLGVELGTTGDLEARRLQRRVGGIDLAAYPTAKDALAALESADVDAVLVDAISAYLYIAAGGKVRMLDDAVLDESYGAVTSRKSVQLRSLVDAIILEMKDDGYLDSLRDEWLLGDAS